MTDDNITRFPISPKKQPSDDRTLVAPFEVSRADRCAHPRFIIDEALAEVECAVCSEKLNPLWVLAQLAREDRRMERVRKSMKEEHARLDSRSRTKCQHCGEMTRISRS